MKIGFIGAGKAGCSLGKYFSQSNKLVGYASKSYESAKEAAALTGSDAFADAAELASRCEALFITTPDGQIGLAWESLKERVEGSGGTLAGKIICHCSGAMPSTALQGAEGLGASAYSVHPLFALSSKCVPASELSHAFFAIEGSQDRIDEIAGMLAELGNPYQVIETEEKARYHAAAVLASNQVIALYRLACNELCKCGFGAEAAEKALAPLFLGNAEHLACDGAVAALTGPAERGDFATIKKHLACLDGQTREVYRMLNDTLLQIAAEKHGDA